MAEISSPVAPSTSGCLSIAVTRGCIEALTPWHNPDLFSRGVPLGSVASRVVVRTDGRTHARIAIASQLGSSREQTGWSSQNTFAWFYKLDVKSLASQVMSVSSWFMLLTLPLFVWCAACTVLLYAALYEGYCCCRPWVQCTWSFYVMLLKTQF